MRFRTQRAAIAHYGRPFEKLEKLGLTLGNVGDSFVAAFLEEKDVPLFRRCLPPGTDVAVLLPAGNFDPPEDHPLEPEFTYAPFLINDFSDISDDVGTLRGVRGVFSQLIEWQPRVDRTKTSLIAIVAPGPYGRTTLNDSNSIPIVGQMLVEHGYNAVGIQCKAGNDVEYHEATSYAAKLSELTGLTMLHVARKGRDVAGTPFSLSVRQLWSPADS